MINNKEIIDAINTIAKYAAACDCVCSKCGRVCPFVVPDAICMPMLAENMIVTQPELFKSRKAKAV